MIFLRFAQKFLTKFVQYAKIFARVGQMVLHGLFLHFPLFCFIMGKNERKAALF